MSRIARATVGVSALLAAAACAIACGSSEQSSPGQGDASSGTGGAAGAPGDAAGTDGPDVVCYNDAGTGLVTSARACQHDSDCQIVPDPTCCGADMAYGVAKTQVAMYASCFGLPPGACQGLGCAKFEGYRTDTGESTPFDAMGTNALSLVAVHCTNSLCTTSVIPPDAGSDAESD